jgi:Lon protease-like protein
VTLTSRSLRAIAELGLFPLPIVLLPTERIPLHIFEERYKELIGECMSEEGQFGLVLEDAQGRREIGTRAAVVDLVHRFDDGRMNIVVEGGERFRLVAPTSGRSFFTAETAPVTDDGERPAADEVEAALDAFRRLASVAEADEVDAPGGGDQLSFELAARVDFGVEVKQTLLELTSEAERLRQLIGLLEQAIASLTRERELHQRASGNGRVMPSGADE